MLNSLFFLSCFCLRTELRAIEIPKLIIIFGSNLILAFSLLSNLKTIVFYNFIILNSLIIYIYLFFTVEFTSSYTLLTQIVNSSTAALKLSYYTWVLEPIFFSTNLFMRVLTQCIIVNLGSNMSYPVQS